MRKIIGILILIILFCSVLFILKGGKKSPKFKTETIERGDIVETVTASGTVNPVTSISVGTQVSGTIRKLYVDFNSPVKKGQLLAEIDPSIFEAQVAQGQANLYNAQANLQKIKSILLNDEKTYKRNKELYSRNFIPRSDVDLAESTYNVDRAQVAAANAQIAQASAALRNNLTNLRYTRIVSPVNGIVVTRNVDVGQTVAASFQTPTLFLVAQDLTQMYIYTSVAEADIGKVKLNQEVEYTLDGYPDRIFKGRVKQIRISPNTIQNVVTYDVVISVSNKDFILKPGMTANVSIITAKKENILLVPNTSLRFTPFHDDENAPKFKTQGVWILKGEKPNRINVKIGISDGSYTEIISGKIQAGDNVITRMIEKPGKQKGNRMGGMRGF